MPELESILQEKRTFKPSKAFSAAAKIKTLAEYTRLAGKAGLTVRHVETTPLGQVGIECTPSVRQ